MKPLAPSSIKKLFASRRFVLIACICLALLAGVYIWWSMSSWSSYNDRFIVAEAQSKTKLQTALDMKADNKDQRAAKLAALSQAVNALPSDESLCNMNALIGWQKILGDLKSRESTCKEKQGRLVALRRSFDKVINYLEAEHALAKLLATAPAGGELAEDAWTQQKDAWTALLKNIENVQSNDEFASVKATSRDVINAIVAAWNEVLAAHQAKDKNRYMKASTALLGAYEGLKTISQHDTDKLQNLLHEVEELYAKLPRA